MNYVISFLHVLKSKILVFQMTIDFYARCSFTVRFKIEGNVSQGVCATRASVPVVCLGNDFQARPQNCEKRLLVSFSLDGY